MNEKFCWPARPPLECKRACTPSAGHIYDFHIFTVIYSSLRRLIWNQHNDQLPVGLLANLIGYCSGIAEVMGSNPVQAWLVFSGLNSLLLKQCSLLRRPLSNSRLYPQFTNMIFIYSQSFTFPVVSYFTHEYVWNYKNNHNTTGCGIFNVALPQLFRCW